MPTGRCSSSASGRTGPPSPSARRPRPCSSSPPSRSSPGWSAALSTFSDGTVVADRLWKRFRKDQARPFLGDQLRALAKRRPAHDRYRWVLRDVDFRIEPGEAVAVVGSNGAGKSTLLKLLTRVTYPYAGDVTIAGRVGAIIEVRGGLHPELTGRENTFLYGALLG